MLEKSLELIAYSSFLRKIILKIPSYKDIQVVKDYNNSNNKKDKSSLRYAFLVHELFGKNKELNDNNIYFTTITATFLTLIKRSLRIF